MKKELKKEIGNRIRKVRESLGFRQAEIVTHFDFGRANYSRIEKGEVFPNAVILHTLKTRFNISLEWLITGEGPMHTPKSRGMGRQLDFAQCEKELNELLECIEKVPMVKHAVLGFFLEYQFKHNTLIRELLDEFDKQEKRKQQETAG